MKMTWISAIGLVAALWGGGALSQEAASQGRGGGEAYLGVSVRPVSPETAAHIELPADVGLTVWQVVPGSPAARAGLALYDVLTELGDQLLVTDRQLAVVVRQHHPGEKLTIRGIRHGVPFVAEATLAERPVGMAPIPQHLQFQLPHAMPGADAAGLLPGNVVQSHRMTSHTASMVHSDGEHTLEVTVANGDRRLVAKDADGKVIFDGPIQTEEQLQAVPEAIREKVSRLHMIGVQVNAPGVE